MDKLKQSLDKANKKLKSNNAGVAIAVRGKSLSLRATLPSKPGDRECEKKQQYISLGIYFNGAGIQQALKLAQKLSADLALKAFDWSDWLKTDSINVETLGFWMKSFEQDYWKRRAKNKKSETTWKVEYQSMFKRLDPQAKISPEALTDLIFTTKPDSRTRVRAVMVANALAKFANVSEDFSRYKGNYSPGLNKRSLPTDEQIYSYYHSIKNEQWQFVFALMAAYGISNHEVFYCDLNSLQKSPGHLVSNYRKAHYGERRIWCLYPQWYEEWELYKPKKLPELTAKNNRDLGGRVTKAFKRYNLCKPGDLRHCWSIRAINFMPIEMAARMQAHDITVHTKTYQRWISKEQEDKLYSLLMNCRDLPLPPNFS